MLPPSISPIISVADASRTSRAGAKAADLSRLAAAGFAVPEAFVIGTDCYRYHLWKSGARGLAATPAEAEEREQIRDAILRTDIPNEVWQAVLNACERLDRECGVGELRMVVRASAVEGPSRLHFPGAYEAYLGIVTPEELSAAIRRVWASLWSGKAAAYRARHERRWEPVMAVIVQRMVNAERLGSASTANIVTGDPTKVMVSSWPASDPTDSTHREVDLRLIAPSDGGGEESAVAERAILVEDAFGGPVEIEWATENGRLRFLQARALEGLPSYFPGEHLPHQSGRGDWRRVTRQPISHLARSLMPLSEGRRWQCDSAAHVNGYVYARGAEPAQAGKSALHTHEKEVAAARELLREWNTRTSAQLRAQIDEVMAADTASIDQSGLMRLLEQAAGASCHARGWLLRVGPHCRRLPELLRDLLRDVPGVDDPEAAPRRLMAGIESPVFMRDARIQDLGSRLSLAWGSGRIEDETWRRDLAMSAWLLAREYGGSFADPLEMHDIACWRSWPEDPDTLWRTIEVAAVQNCRPTLVTRHVAAQAAAIEEAAGLADRLRGATRKRFEELVKLARDCTVLHDEVEHACALASAALRGVLAELAGRMIDAGLIGERCDIFYFSLDELLAVSLKPGATEQSAMRAKVAERKHALWLERRLVAPDALVDGDANLSS